MAGINHGLGWTCFRENQVLVGLVYYCNVLIIRVDHVSSKDALAFQSKIDRD